MEPTPLVCGARKLSAMKPTLTVTELLTACNFTPRTPPSPPAAHREHTPGRVFRDNGAAKAARFCGKVFAVVPLAITSNRSPQHKLCSRTILSIHVCNFASSPWRIFNSCCDKSPDQQRICHDNPLPKELQRSSALIDHTPNPVRGG